MEFPRVSVVFATYGDHLPFVIALVESLERQSYGRENLEIICVDNASSPNVSEWITRTQSYIKCIPNEINIGTPRAYNQGIKIATGKYLLLVNDDNLVPENTIQEAIIFLERHHEYDGIALRVVNADGSPSFNRLYIFSLLSHSQSRPQKVNFVTISNFIGRTSVFNKVGLFDENIFFFNEDLDWSWRARRANCRFIYLPAFTIQHRHWKTKNVYYLERLIVRQMSDLYFYYQYLRYLYPLVKNVYKVELYRFIRKHKISVSFPRLRSFLNIEQPVIRNNLYQIEKELMLHGIEEALKILSPSL